MDSVSVNDMKVPGAVEISPGRLSVVEGIGRKAHKEYAFPLRFEIAAILVCRQGFVRLVLNDQPITFRSGEMLFINPDSVLEQFEDKNGDCDITLIMIAEAERFRSVVIDRHLWDLMLYLRRRPVIRLGKDDLELADVYKRLIELLLKSSFICFIVEDSGIGVPPEDAERIFEHFVQLDDYREGTGTGLTLARSLSRRLGGDVILDTSYTFGTRFIFSLPLLAD